ncbi:TetR/AcrR family transcriptional regulator [uncultured Maritimibacter sp.]|jgi:AcrR family transcriptional regulator|uniref:TetR/AcrR family transcriptional regulator n=1 Tax=uncultured Maritimibacter sp. TaxID=991866 RepID=UPI00262D450C|nr:TetR/AcrR family transcriptional regulator [uncultured Maritimibacter sp.]
MTETFVTPVQTRSRRSFERMVTAGMDLIRRDPTGAFSMQDLARASGTSVGAIYQRFGNKETAMVMIHTAIMERLDREAQARFSLGDRLAPEVAVAEAVRRFCDHVLANMDVLSGMVIQGTGLEASTARGMESSRTIGALFQGFLAHHLGPDPTRHEMVFRMVCGMTWRHMFATDDAEYVVPLPLEAVLDGMVAMAQSYLLTPR